MGEQGCKVLVVDDDPSIQELLKIILEKNGYLVHQAIDGDQAVQLFSEVRPNLVISDVSMPKGDGFNVAILIRSKERGSPKTPILLISAFYDDQANRENAQRCGADAFLSKPFTQKELLAAVRSLLEAQVAAG